MTKQDPAKVKARKDRRKARAEEARMSSRRTSNRESSQQYEIPSLHQQVPQERLGQTGNHIFGADAALEPLSLGHQESGSFDLAGLSRYNFFEAAMGLQENAGDSSSKTKREESKKS